MVEGPRMEAAFCQVVRRWSDQRLAELPGSSPRLAAAEQSRDRLGGRAGRPACADVSHGLAGGEPVRQRPQRPRRQARGPRDDVLTSDPRTPDRPSGLRPDRNGSYDELVQIKREDDYARG